MKLLKGILTIAFVGLIAVSCKETKTEEAVDAATETATEVVEETVETTTEVVETTAEVVDSVKVDLTTAIKEIKNLVKSKKKEATFG